jgi:hypothetical protein
MPPVQNVATGLGSEELSMLTVAIERHAPELAFLLRDTTHVLTLPEADRLVDAIAAEMTASVDTEGYPDDRAFAYDDLIDRVNWGPYLR